MKPKIISICGSPRKDGNTAVLLSEALKGAGDYGAETEEIFLLDYNIGFCDGCEKCYVNDGRKIGECSLKDDMTNYLVDKIYHCDGLILGTPSYWSNVSAIMKNFIDRMIVFTYDRGDCGPAPRLHSGRKAMLYVVGAVSYRVSSFGGVHYLPFQAMNCICTFANIEVVDFLTASSVDQPGDIQQQPDLLRQAYTQGKNFAAMFS